MMRAGLWLPGYFASSNPMHLSDPTASKFGFRKKLEVRFRKRLAVLQLTATGSGIHKS